MVAGESNGSRSASYVAGQMMARVGSELKRVRRERRITLEQLAEQSNVSSGLISQIERGKGNPSFNTLVLIAHALDMPMARLFNTEPTTSPVVRAADRSSMDFHKLDTGDAEHWLLSPNLGGDLEAVLVIAPPGYDTSDSPFSHPGEEFAHIIEGTHEVYLDGQRYELGPGDSITYNSSIPHWYRNPGDVPVRAIWVITPPTF